MLDAVAAIPGVESAGLSDALLLNDQNTSNVFTDTKADLRPSNVAASAYLHHVSPDYVPAEGTTLVAGRAFTGHDDKSSLRVVVVSREFDHKIFGSKSNAIGSYCKKQDGTRIQVVGIAEDGKYAVALERTPRDWWCARAEIRSNWGRT